MIRRRERSKQVGSSAASDGYKGQARKGWSVPSGYTCLDIMLRGGGPTLS